MDLDLRRALRSPGALRRLVDAVANADSAATETDWVEWKRDLDFGARGHCFDMARHILGFANRSTHAAGRQLDGCAYIVVGAEPGSVHGTELIDPAVLGDKITPFTGVPEPQWYGSYVEVDGRHVLVVTVEAPRLGDPPFALQRSFDGHEAGKVFIRRPGKTVQASPAELQMLVARARAVRNASELMRLEVRRAVTDPLRPVRDAGGGISDFIAEERTRLMKPLEDDQGYGAFGGVLRERRHRQDYATEVDRYLGKAADAWSAWIDAEAFEREIAAIDLDIVNLTDSNFAGVQLELVLPSDVGAAFSAREARQASGFPEPPQPWGATPALNLGFERGAPRSPGGRVSREPERTHVAYDAIHVRPAATHKLHTLLLAVPDERAGAVLMCEWVITSTEVDGTLREELALAVSEHAMHGGDLAATARAGLLEGR